MAWTEITRPKYQRDGLRYASDTTDAEWSQIEPHLPAPATRGRTRETKLRDIVDAVFYIAQSGCQWRMLPKDFPPHSTVQRYFYTWRDKVSVAAGPHGIGDQDHDLFPSWRRKRIRPRMLIK